MSETRAIDGGEPVNWGHPAMAAFALPEENVADRDDWLTSLAARKDLLSDVNRLLDNRDDSLQNQTPPARPANDESLDPSLAAVNALVDPVSHPDDAPKANRHHATPPTGNGLNTPPPNLAGAGQGPGGTSTPFSPGGGNGSGGGGGPADPLHGLNHAVSETSANSGNAAMAAQMRPAASGLTPGGDPPIPFVEGTSANQIVGTFTDSDGNTNPSKYTASIDWGNGQQTTGFVTYSNGQFQIQGVMDYAEEGNYTITTTVTDQDGDITTVNATAAVSDAPLTPGMIAPISATAGQPYNGSFGSFTDGNHNAPISDFTVQINWGDGQNSAGTVAGSGGTYTVGGSHTYTAPGSYAVSATVTDDGGSQTTLNTTATVAAAPIVVSNPGSQSNAEGNAVSLQIQASGGTGALSFGSTNLPSGLTIDSTSGLISGTLDYTDAETQGGHYFVTVTAYDSTGKSSSTNFSWTVTDTNTPPTLDNPGDLTDWQGDAVALQLSASDPDGDPLSYATTGLPNGLSINTTTGLISGVLAAPDGASSPYTVTVSASDGTTTAQQTFTWTVATVQVDPMADQSNLIGDSVSVPINAWDQSGTALTYSAAGLPPGLSINSTTGLISGTIASNASVTTPYNVTVTATDGTDPASTTFAWTISNFVLDNPGDQSNAEGDAVALQPTVETNGNPSLTFSATDLPNGLAINPTTGLIAGTLANLDSNNSPYSVTISATDGTSTSSQTFTWTVTHVVLTDPDDQINAAGDVVSLPIQASDPDNDALTYTASGLPAGLSINTTTGLISGTIAANAGSDTPYSVTVTASDGTHTATDTFSWTVANQAVSVTNPGTQNNAEGANVSLQINATDPADNPLNFTAVGLPLGLQIDYASGLISGTVDGSAAETNGGVYQVTVLADDGQGNNGSTTFTWNVSHTNQAPTLDNPGDQVDQTGDVVSLPLFGYDADGDDVTYSAAGLPPGLSIDQTTGIISGTLPASAGSGTPYSVTVTASDGTLTASQTFNWFVTANTVTLTNPGDQTNTEGDVVSLQLSASGSGLTYQASGLPSGLSINGSTGLISGTVASGDAANGPYVVTVTATDTQGNSSAQQFLWSVNATNLNPVVTSPGAQINAQGDVLSLQMQATDPAGNGLTYSAIGLPPGLTIDPSSGLISGVLSNNASGSPYTVTVTATDGSNSGSATITWSVTNQAVTVTNPGTQSGTGGGAASLQISASDPAQLPLTYAAVGLPDGLSIDADTGLISGTMDSSAGGAYAVTVMASDSQGNSGSVSFTWNVTYLNQAPTLDNPGDQLDQAGYVVSLQLSGSDVDGDTVTYSATGLPSGLSLNQTTGIISGTIATTAGSGTPYSVTVTASDGTLTATQTFNWFVTKAPVTLTSPGDQTNTEGDAVSLQLSASGSGLSYQASGLPSGLSLNTSTGLISGTVATGDAANGPYTVTVTATDTQGHSSAQQFTWNINVPANSLTLTNPGNQSNAEGNTVSLQVQGSDADGDTLEYAASGLPIGLWIDPITGLIQGQVDYSAAEISGGQYHVTVTANDGNGQTANQSFVWTIADTPRAPWLLNPTVQNSVTGTSVSLPLVAGSPDGRQLTYSAQQLPPGLGINTQTGVISGQMQAAAGSSYQVTVTVTDTANLTASQTFTWQVTSSPAPQVILAINGTPQHSDDVGLVNPSVVIPLKITLQNASQGQLHTVQISFPSNLVELSQSQIKLYNGGSATVWLTPVQASQAPDDVDIQASVDGFLAANQKMTIEDITIKTERGGVGHISNKDTPAGMADRIPPSADGKVTTPVTVTFSVDLGAGETVFVDIVGDGAAQGGSANNGEVWFKDGDDKPHTFSVTGSGIKGDHRYNLWGTSQTKPGFAGKIILSVGPVPDSKKSKNSEGFSVAAIPVAVKMSKATARAGDYEVPDEKDTENRHWLVGATYNLTYVSDSRALSDLDKVEVSEKLVPERGGEGAPSTWELTPSGWIAATEKQQSDAHGPTPVVPKTERQPQRAALSAVAFQIFRRNPGTQNIDQWFVFTDARTGTTNKTNAPLVQNSGFLIVMTASQEGRGRATVFSVGIEKKPNPEGGAEAGTMSAANQAVQRVRFNSQGRVVS